MAKRPNADMATLGVSKTAAAAVAPFAAPAPVPPPLPAQAVGGQSKSLTAL
jgi:hypothetical protein